MSPIMLSFFFNDTATTEIYTLSLHDALPICLPVTGLLASRDRTLSWHAAVLFAMWGDTLAEERLCAAIESREYGFETAEEDRKSTRLNSSHANISYAVFCLKKKKHNPSLISA